MMQSTQENRSVALPDRTLEAPAVEGRLLEPLIVLAKRKTLILKVAIAGALSGLAVAVLLPSKFEATARIMLPQQNQSIAASMLGQLGPLAMAAGKDLGLRNPGDLYIAMLHCRSVADALIGRFPLMQVYKKSKIEDARKRLDALTEINAGRESVIAIDVRNRDAQRAADIANAYVDELQKLKQMLAVSEAGRRRWSSRASPCRWEYLWPSSSNRWSRQKRTRNTQHVCRCSGFTCPGGKNQQRWKADGSQYLVLSYRQFISVITEESQQ